MAERGQRKSGVSRQSSQSVVVDPETERRLTKQSLADKTGIAPQQQRLLFTPSESEDPQNCPPLSASSGTSWFVAGDWEGLLFKNDRAIGKLVEPSVRIERLPDYQVIGGATAPAAIHRLELSFADWRPAGDRSSRGGRQPLRLTADDSFRQSSCRVQIFRRGRDGRARPFESPWHFTGQELLQGHNYSLQLRERVEEHKRKESSLVNLSAIEGVPGIVTPVSIENNFWGLTTYIQVEEKRLTISKLDLRCLVVTPSALTLLPDMPLVSARAETLEAPERGVMGVRVQATTASVHVPGHGGHAAPSDAGPGSQGASGSHPANLGGNIAGVPEVGLVCGPDEMSLNHLGNAAGSYTAPPQDRQTTSGRANGRVRTAGRGVVHSAKGHGKSPGFGNWMKGASDGGSTGGAGPKWQTHSLGAGCNGVFNDSSVGDCHLSGEEAGSPGSTSTASVESARLAFAETDCSEDTAEMEPESPLLSRVSMVDTAENSMETSDGLCRSIQVDDNGSSDGSSTIVQARPTGTALEGRSEPRAPPAKLASKDPGRSSISPSTGDPKSVLLSGLGFTNDRSDSSSSAGTAEVPAHIHRASKSAQPSRGSVSASRGWLGPRPTPAPAWPPQGQGLMHGPGRGLPPAAYASAVGQNYMPPPQFVYNYHPPPVPRYVPHCPPGHTFPPAAVSEWAGGYLVYPPGVMPPGLAPPAMFHGGHPWGQPHFGPPAWETQASGPCPPLPLGQPGYLGSLGLHPWGSGPAMHMWPQQQVLPPMRHNWARDNMRVPPSQERSGRTSARGKGPPAQKIDMGKRVAGHQERALEGPPVHVRLPVGGGRQDPGVPREQDVQEQQTEANVSTKPNIEGGSSGHAECPMTLRRQPVCDLERLMLEFLPRLPPCPDGGRPDRDLSLGVVLESLQKPSYFGCELSAHGWPLGKSLAYFAPVLSACRLFINAENGKQEERDLTVYEVETPAGPERVAAVVEAAEKGHPHLRKPLFERLMELIRETGRGSQLLDEALATVHPASWLSVQWYPVYRLPSAPLRAEFLTFHSFQPVPLATTQFGAIKAQDVAQASSGSSGGGHILPIVGFRCKVPKEEHWLDINGEVGPDSPSTLSNTRPDPMADLASLGLSNHAAELAYCHGVHVVKKAAGFEDFVFDDLRVFPDISEV